jgi:hypothetical protein
LRIPLPGVKGKPEVNLVSSLSFDRLSAMPRFQTEYTQGKCVRELFYAFRRRQLNSLFTATYNRAIGDELAFDALCRFR